MAYGWVGSMEWSDDEAARGPWETVTLHGERYGWDVARLIDAAQGHEPVMVDPAGYVEDVTDRAWARGVDVWSPVIFVPHPDTGRWVLVDGRHRVFKAARMGMAGVPAVFLTEAEEEAARFTDEEWALYRRVDGQAQQR